MIKSKRLLLTFLILTLPFILNCGGGGGGGGSTGTGVTGLSGEQLITDGWNQLQNSNNSASITNFQTALSQSLSDAQTVTANTGLGWAKTRNGEIIEAIPFFEQAAPKDQEAAVGLANALLVRNSSGDLPRAKQLLVALPPDTFVSSHAALGLTSDRIHALAALAFALSGDSGDAKASINKAIALKTSSSENTINRINEGFTFLGW